MDLKWLLPLTNPLLGNETHDHTRWSANPIKGVATFLIILDLI